MASVNGSSNGTPGPVDWAPTPIDTHFGAREIGWQALGPALGCSVLATIVVTLRWYTRCRLAQCVGVDDLVILLSLVCAPMRKSYLLTLESLTTIDTLLVYMRHHRSGVERRARSLPRWTPS